MLLLILKLLYIFSVALPADIHHEFLTASQSQNKIEFYWSKPQGTGPWPLLILLHPHQEWPNKIGGEVFVKNNAIETWTKNNFFTVAISLPGYGKTVGASDFCGPTSQKAVEEIIEHFETLSIIKKNKTFLYGGSRGAVIASLLATKRKFAGVVLKSGLYDFETAYNNYPWYSSIKLAMIWELGFNNENKLKERSVINFAEKIDSPLLLIHGSDDSRASIDIAKNFSNKVRNAGHKVKFIILDSEHFIPMEKIKPYMEAFFSNLK